jgi:hypothetical protein
MYKDNWRDKIDAFNKDNPIQISNKYNWWWHYRDTYINVYLWNQKHFISYN